MLKRLLGLIIILASVVVLIILGAAAFYFGPVLDQIGEGVDGALTLTVETLETVSATLVQTQSTLSSMNGSLDTAAQTTANLSQTVADTVPLLDQMSTVITDQLPANIEAIENAVPNIAEVAGVVDDALTRLSDFEIKQTIPIPFNPIELQWDLGIQYNPQEPFDESITALGTSLEGLPEELRLLQGELQTSAANLQVLSEDLLAASGDVAALNAELAKFIPLFDQYLALIDQLVDGIEQTRVQIANNVGTIRLVGTILPFAMALTQLAPLVVGWELLRGKRETQVIVQEVPVQPEAEDVAKAAEEIKEQKEQAAAGEAQDTLAQILDDAQEEEKT